jgi:hypothetical protein
VPLNVDSFRRRVLASWRCFGCGGAAQFHASGPAVGYAVVDRPGSPVAALRLLTQKPSLGRGELIVGEDAVRVQVAELRELSREILSSINDRGRLWDVGAACCQLFGPEIIDPPARKRGQSRTSLMLELLAQTIEVDLAALRMLRVVEDVCLSTVAQPWLIGRDRRVELGCALGLDGDLGGGRLAVGGLRAWPDGLALTASPGRAADVRLRADPPLMSSQERDPASLTVSARCRIGSGRTPKLASEAHVLTVRASTLDRRGRAEPLDPGSGWRAAQDADGQTRSARRAHSLLLPLVSRSSDAGSPQGNDRLHPEPATSPA